MRALLTVAIAASIPLVAPADEPKPVPPAMIIDSGWSPSPGDEVTVHPIGAPSFPTAYALDEYMKFADAKDAVGMKGFDDRKLVTLLDKGTRILVVQVRGRPVSYVARSGMSGARMQRSMQDAILNPNNEPEIHVAVEARVLDGPHKDQLRFVPADSLARLKPSPSVESRKPERPKPVEPAVRAATLLQSARNLEKAGNLRAARDTYRRIVKEFPGTPSTAPASGRLKATGGP